MFKNEIEGNWSEWQDVTSVDDGILVIRNKIGHQVSFQGAEDKATAFLDIDANNAIAEVLNFGTADCPEWKCRFLMGLL